MTLLQNLADDEISELPIDRLGLLILDHLVDSKEWNSYNFLNSAAHSGRSVSIQHEMSEGLNWLVARGLVARGTPGQSSSEAIFVTRLGKRVLSEGLDLVKAGQRLDLDLHSLLAGARSQFLMGEFELAAFAAMREVEIRVRALADADESLIGVRLMRDSFNPETGRLADRALDSGERVGVMDLFAGSIGTFKNPSSHRQVDYEDPTEASEVVLLADLLMRLLDRVAGRIGSS